MLPNEVDLRELVRRQEATLGEVEAGEVEIVVDLPGLPPPGSITLGASGLESRQRHARQLIKLGTAKWLAYGVLAIFGTTVISLIVWAWWAGTQNQTNGTASITDVLEFGKFILPYQVTALGVTLGFYFAGRSEE